ncbi:hypothetical protein [Nakamurella aerolata]|uniref:hypothetical protein n=1 Tax=Nakamurella aerolata TaxID=1656892 RepID=UPI001BB27867|nr:hypothetical protein [Nakamurella aerolata]
MAASALAEEEPELAWRHARAARSKGGRIAVVRETVGLVAYRAGQWQEAISELRAARRMGGGPGHLAVMADSERALGQPDRALELGRSAEAEQLDDDGRIELTVVLAGARADLGQIDAALVALEQAGVTQPDADPRLLYAYGDLLQAAGRRDEALTWFVRAYDADAEEDTDAADRIAELAAPTAAADDTAAHDSAADDAAAADADQQHLRQAEHGTAGTDSGRAASAGADSATTAGADSTPTDSSGGSEDSR